MKLTQHDQLVLGLEALGYRRLPKKNKYTMFHNQNVVTDRQFAFVGKAGALRFNSKAAASSSYSASDRRRDEVLNAQFVTEGL